MYKDDYEICKRKNECINPCKHRNHCKLYVMRMQESIVTVKRVCKNAKLPIRGTERAAGYDLAAAQTTVIPAQGKVLVKIGLSMALPLGCHGRIAPKSGLALKKFIDVGVGVVDTDYRRELRVILFNFGKQDFAVNMVDKIAQLIVEKIKTPTIKQTDSLEESRQDSKGYGSRGINSERSEPIQDIKTKISNTDQSSNSSQEEKKQSTNGSVQKQSQLSQRRQIISARQIQKFPKDGNLVFLSIVRQTSDTPPKPMKKGNKRSSHRVANFVTAYSITEGEKRKINREIDPKKDIISVTEREQQVANNVRENHWKHVETLIKEYQDIFAKKLAKVVPPSQEVHHHIEIKPSTKPTYRPPYR